MTAYQTKCPLPSCPYRDVTPHQLKLFKMVSIEGLTSDVAAKKYGISRAAIRNACAVVLLKTGSKHIAQALYKLMKMGKID